MAGAIGQQTRAGEGEKQGGDTSSIVELWHAEEVPVRAAPWSSGFGTATGRKSMDEPTGEAWLLGDMGLANGGREP